MEQLDTSDDEQGMLLEDKGRKESRFVEIIKDKKWVIVFGCAAILALAIIVAFVATKSSSSSNCYSYSASDKCFFKGRTRLPKVLKPLTYKIRLQPDLTTFEFTGRVVILVKCVEATNRIVFHQKRLTFDKTTLALLENGEGSSKRESKEIKVDEMRMDVDHEQVIIRTKESLRKDTEYTITVEFHGKLNDNLEGFYKSSYKTKKGEIRYLATTHFEATAARQAFPCFDEPAMKANFTITLVHPVKYVALSNMPVKSSRILSNKLNETEFEPSVKMSTYLVAFVVCDFKSVQMRTARGVEVRIWAPADQINQTDLALSSAGVILPFYEKYFGVKYPLPKQDLIAIPDFSAGAMENWGLITYRLTSLLVDPQESSSSNRQWVATVVAHELAHQWFGNLVTMKWWDDLWLNEGFASYVENVGVNKFRPTWKMMDQFLITNIQRSMHLDQLANSHPISVVVKDPNEISSLFDDISYHKGSSLINMMNYVLGSDVFLKGLQSYLRKYEYGNAATDDLWNSLSQNTDVNVKEVMDTWTLQMGFPLVTIKKQENGKYLATQEHFLVHPDVKPALKSPYNYKWHIPLKIRTDNNDTISKIYWMKRGDISIDVNIAKDGWLKVNHKQNGYYRVNYPKENWENLAKTLNSDHTKLSAADRAGLIDDAFALARAGKLSYPLAFNISLYLNKEREYVPWRAALTSLAYIGARLAITPYYGLYQNYVLSKVTPVLDALKYEDKGEHIKKYLRDILFSEAVLFDYKPAIAVAKQFFDDFMNNNQSVVPNFRYTVYSFGVRNGGRKEWEFMWKRYNNEIVAAEKKKLLSSLTDSRRPWLLERCLEYSLNSSLIKSQDADSVISNVAGNPNGRLLAWDFFRVNYKELRKRYGSEAFSFGRLVKSVTAHFQTEFHYNEVKRFFEANPDVGSAERSLQQSYETIKSNTHWVQNHQDEVVQWLREHQSQ